MKNMGTSPRKHWTPMLRPSSRVSHWAGGRGWQGSAAPASPGKETVYTWSCYKGAALTCVGGCEVGEVPGEEVPDQAGEDAAQHAPQAEHQHAGRRHQPDT